MQIGKGHNALVVSACSKKLTTYSQKAAGRKALYLIFAKVYMVFCRHAGMRLCSKLPGAAVLAVCDWCGVCSPDGWESALPGRYQHTSQPSQMSGDKPGGRTASPLSHRYLDRQPAFWLICAVTRLKLSFRNIQNRYTIRALTLCSVFSLSC